MNEKIPLNQELELGAGDEKAGVMTKAELVDEVARVVQLTKKQVKPSSTSSSTPSSIHSVRVRRSSCEGSAVFAFAAASRVPAAIPRPERRWKSHRRRFRTSSRARS